ncbi:MAG: hypothetical protein M1818_008355 [Claussenomyces sp. TS43310]|nr:MAG: hypothetical protein M1818_008355 [Claussenomyces sp. TS43310]
MASSDLSVLLDMGFDKERADMAVKKSGGLQGALQWLEDNQDKPIEDLRLPAASIEADENDPTAEPPALAEGETAHSLVCDECGKRFRSVAQAEFHGNKTGHENFSESTEEIAPLSEEEKKQKLEELRQKAKEKRVKQATIDKEEAKKNEKIRMKSTKEIEDIKEDLEKKQRIKEAEAKRQEKLNDIAAKKRIQEKIAADKEERRLKAERAKAEREGRAPPPDPSLAAAAAATTSAATRPAGAHTEARLRLQTPTGNKMKTFPADATLFEVAQALESEGTPVGSFTMTFPKKVFEGAVDFGKTLKEAGLVPSAVLIVK